MVIFVYQIWGEKTGLGQSEGSDPAPHLVSGIQFAPVVLRWGTTPVSSSHPFLRAEAWRTDRENPTTQMQLHISQEKLWQRGLLPPSFFATLSSRLKLYTSNHCPREMLWQSKTVNSRSKKWHEQISGFQTWEVGWEGPLSRSVSPEDKTRVRSGRHGKTVWAHFWLLCWMK